MLTTIKVANFKSFKLADLKLRRLNVFVGPNNSGKSSILAAIRLLTQTAECTDPSVRLLLNGPLGDFGTFKDLVYQNQTKRHIELSFGFEPDKRYLSTLPIPPRPTVHLRYKYRPSLREVILTELRVFGGEKRLLHLAYVEESEKFIPRAIGRNRIPPTSSPSIARDIEVRNFSPRSLVSQGREEKFYETLRLSNRTSIAAVRTLQAMEYVGAMRALPSRTYFFGGERRKRVGSLGEHAPAILAMDSARRGSKSKNIRGQVVNWLRQASLAADVRIQPLSDRYYELQIQHPVTKEYENFADVGFGNSQVIPVLVAGYMMDSGDTLLVEQPEIHLHPKAQAELGDFFSELAGRGVQSLVETHSEHLILRLQQHVARGDISHQDIAFFYVHATSAGKTITRIRLNREGLFTTAWPGGFFPERLNEAKQFALDRSKLAKP